MAFTPRWLWALWTPSRSPSLGLEASLHFTACMAVISLNTCHPPRIGDPKSTGALGLMNLNNRDADHGPTAGKAGSSNSWAEAGARIWTMGSKSSCSQRFHFENDPDPAGLDTSLGPPDLPGKKNTRGHPSARGWWPLKWPGLAHQGFAQHHRQRSGSPGHPLQQ